MNSVVQVDDAEAAKTRLREDAFDCVVSEYTLPASDGLALLDHVHRDGEEIPFLLFTDSGSEGVHPEDRDKVQAAMECVAGGEALEMEYRGNPKEDFQRWGWVQGQPVYDDAGNLTRIVGLTRDITERKAYEKQLDQTRDELVEEAAVDVFEGNGFFVADDGAGIAEEKQETVFEFGYSSDEHGTGIGPAIVQEIAGVHGWTCRVVDSGEGGARFEIVGGTGAGRRLLNLGAAFLLLSREGRGAPVACRAPEACDDDVVSV